MYDESVIFEYYMQDEIGELSVHDNGKIYWVSFMNGLQRCLLFTEDHGFATVAHEVNTGLLLKGI